MLKWIFIGLAVIALAVWAVGYAAGRGTFGSHEGPGQVTGAERPVESVEAAAAAVRDAATGIGVSKPKQILFGDLHVHTTFSFDAFLFSLPFMQGEGAHPPADACDFARYCSAVDFWSINDHAFSITPEHWRETVDSIRQCNEVAGDPANPDAVAFLGWEWTQVGTEPGNHWGHKNVVLAHTDEERIPARPIAALRGNALAESRTFGRGLLAVVTGEERLHDLNRYFSELESADRCPEGVPVRDLPTDCIEGAATPADLYRKLDDWGHDAIVIPHGTTWGFYTPPGSSWDKQLVGAQHDEDRQTLVEVYSGHGSSEVHRPWRGVDIAEGGSRSCPEPSDGYLPSCWRAGEIIRARCLEAGETQAECEERAVTARAHAAEAGVAVRQVVPGTEANDWLDAGQCPDCIEPAFNYRPGNSAQYMLAIGGFEDEGEPRRFRPGFMASSDNHFARPGTGYKEINRRGFTESLAGVSGRREGPIADMLQPKPEDPAPESRPFDLEQPGFQFFETERQGSFLTTGGLIAAHSEGRDRASIWQAMQRREVYGTSGPRILLWFDLLNPPGARGGETLPMGSEVTMDDAPIFQVRAVGSFEQKPGCPDDSVAALSPERLEHLCKGECYNPGDRRRAITRIEIVRILPQLEKGEDVTSLIQDPWRSFRCDGDPAGCSVTFTDPGFRSGGREAVYYARVFEAPKPTINGGNLRCERDAEGNCLRTHPCAAEGDDPFDECRVETEPRAWSSPIYVDVAEPAEVASAR